MYVSLIMLGLAAVAVGIYLVVTNPGPGDFGWFAYAPLPDDVPDVGGVVLTTCWQVAGAAMCASGLIVLASCVGYRLGRRRRFEELGSA